MKYLISIFLFVYGFSAELTLDQVQLQSKQNEPKKVEQKQADINNSFITKYKYGKMLRAQLSTYEQAILLINSISSLGMKWDYNPEKYENDKINPKLITEFQLIKNLPGEQMFGIKYNVYYPNVKFETMEI